MQEQRQHHWPCNCNDNDGDGDDDDDHLTYEERLRVDSYKMLMPIIHLPYKPYKYQHRRLHDKLSCSYDNNNATAATSHQRHQGVVRRVSDDNVDVSGVVSDTDDDESKAHMKEDEDDCKSDEQKSKQDRKEDDAKHQCKMSMKTFDGNGGSNSNSTTTSTENKC